MTEQVVRLNQLAFLFFAAVFIYLCSLPLGIVTQGLIVWPLLLLLIAVSYWQPMHSHLGRVAFFVLITFISLRYLIWRATSTLVYTGPIDFAMTALLFIAEIQVALVYLLSVVTNLWPLKREPVALPEDESILPTVDIFLPTYTEDLDIIRVTAIAATQIDYPKDKFNIYIIDDGSSDARCADTVMGPPSRYRRRVFKEFAESIGVNYLTRPDNSNAKAGNVNNALKHSSGDLVLILDCDHVPTQDILKETVGWFIKDPKLFLVQTPHFFINPDPLEKNLGSFQKAPSENEMFYRGVQPCMDFWNAAFFCGSAALLKRSMLDEVGGMRGETITEDCETSLALHAKGYNSVYYEKPMVCGLSPETFEDFLVQRTRWCQGMLQMGFLNNPTVNTNLTWPQRICYTSFYLFWFFGAARFMFFITPTLFLLFGIQVYHASLEEVAVYAIPHLIASFLVMRFIYGKYRWPLFSELYESVQSIFLVPAVIGVIENPRAPSFKVTPKGHQTDQDFMSPLVGPFYLMFFLMLISIPSGIMMWLTKPYAQDGVVICMIWLTINLMITFSALGVFWEQRQIRHYHRAWASGEARVVSADGTVIAEAQLHDMSVSGIGLEWSKDVDFGEQKSVRVQMKNSYGTYFDLEATIVFQRPTGDTFYVGLKFDDMDKNLPTLINLVYGDSKRWEDCWNRRKENPSVGFIIRLFFKMGVYGISHALDGMKVLVNHYKQKWKSYA